MAGDAALLMRVIRELGLARDNNWIAQVEALGQAGHLPDGIAKAMHYKMLPEIERAIDFPNRLHRPPRAEQLYADGKADIEFFTLVEGEEGLRYGIRLFDMPRHMLIAGSTGSGKTNVFRAIIFRIHELNLEEMAKK